MSVTSSPDHFAVRFGRPRIREGTSDAEVAIFAATERLLEAIPFSDIRVAQIIKDAGISRATFYHYFSSKLSVIAGLLARIMNEMFETAQPFLRHEGALNPADSLRISMRSALTLWSKHRIVLRTVMENWGSDQELGALWFGIMSRFADAVSAEIDFERDAGSLPPGPPSRQLAAALIWSTERCLYVAGLGVDDTFTGEEAVVDTLVTLWVGALQTGLSTELQA